MLGTVEKMFGCVHSAEQTHNPTYAPTQRRPNATPGPSTAANRGAVGAPLSLQQNSHSSADGERDRDNDGLDKEGEREKHWQAAEERERESLEMFDTVVAEGMKYKRKCKALKAALLELETRSLAEKSALMCQFEDARTQYERALGEGQAQHFIELTQCRQEREDELQSLAMENERLREREGERESLLREREGELERLRVRERESEVLLRETVQKRERELVREREEAETVWREREKELSSQLERERERVLVLEGERDSLKEIVDELTHRLNEYSLACPECVSHKASIALLEIEREELRYERQRLTDESLYLREENARLDKQVTLVKGDLERARANTSPDFRTLLKSEREQKLQAELQAAKEQISEMSASIESVVRSKDAVEQGVKTVLQENDSLSASLSAAQARIAQLESELSLSLQHALSPTHPLSPSPWGSRWERETVTGASTPSRPSAAPPLPHPVPPTTGTTRDSATKALTSPSLSLSSVSSASVVTASSLPALGRGQTSLSAPSTAAKRVSFSDTTAAFEARRTLQTLVSNDVPHTK